MNVAGQVEKVLALTCERRGVTREQLMRHQRRRHLVDSRWVAVYALHLMGLSEDRIGAIMDRDRTTVWHAVRMTERDPKLMREAQAIFAEATKPPEVATLEDLIEAISR